MMLKKKEIIMELDGLIYFNLIYATSTLSTLAFVPVFIPQQISIIAILLGLASKLPDNYQPLMLLIPTFLMFHFPMFSLINIFSIILSCQCLFHRFEDMISQLQDQKSADHHYEYWYLAKIIMLGMTALLLGIPFAGIGIELGSASVILLTIVLQTAFLFLTQYTATSFAKSELIENDELNTPICLLLQLLPAIALSYFLPGFQWYDFFSYCYWTTAGCAGYIN